MNNIIIQNNSKYDLITDYLKTYCVEFFMKILSKWKRI